MALHPGTVASPLSVPFAGGRSGIQAPEEAADALLAVVDRLTVSDTGCFFDHGGLPVPW